MYCIKCGAAMPEGTRTCTQCGAPIRPHPVQQPRVPGRRSTPAEEEIYLPTPKKKKALPIVLLIVLLALVAAGCVLLFVPAVHDAVFGAPELAFTQEELTLAAGEQQDLTADMALGSRKAGDLKWTSSAPDVAYVQDGILTAADSGVCTITVVDPDSRGYDTLRVTVTGGDTAPAEATQQPAPAETAQPEAGSSTVQIAENIDVDVELQQIRSWYYNPGAGDVRREISAGTNGWGYSREYLYHNGQLVFAYVYGGGEEHRLYFKDGSLFFVIETDRTEYRLEATEPFLPMAEQAKADALNYAP